MIGEYQTKNGGKFIGLHYINCLLKLSLAMASITVFIELFVIDAQSLRRTIIVNTL